jgi:hypothetical protein
MANELTKPFPVSRHKWRVLNVSKAGDKATWYVYVDARDVAERLDEAGVEWSDDYEIVTLTDSLCVAQCRLTVDGQTRTDVGSDSAQSRDSEGNYIKGAYSDALKRAAVKFGVARYLYRLTSVYLPIDPKFKQFTKESEARIRQHLVNELTKLGAEKDADPQPDVEAESDAPSAAEDEWNGIPAVSDGDGKPEVPVALRKKFHGLGVELYGDGWDAKRRELVRAVTTGQAESSNDLTEAEIQRLIAGMEKVRSERQPVNGTAA